MDHELHSAEKIKPAVLYHGTTKVIKELVPHQQSIRDPSEGPVVFATPRKDLATAFCLPTDDSWVKIGIRDDNVCEMVIADETRFKNLDIGGIVYELPSTTFSYRADKGMGFYEWTSKEPVSPSGSSTFKSVLNELLEQGVNVYFIDPLTFEKYRKTPGEQRGSILKNIESENERIKRIEKELKSVDMPKP